MTEKKKKQGKKEKPVTLCSGSSRKAVEKLFVPNGQLERYRAKLGLLPFPLASAMSV